MKKWLLQSTTLAGLISIPITVLQGLQSGGDWITVVLAALNALLLLVRDGKFLSGLCLVALIGIPQAACSKIDIPISSQIEAATTIGCAVIEESGCYDELSAALPGLTEETCEETVFALLTVANTVIEEKTLGDKDVSNYLQAVTDIVADLSGWEYADVNIEALLAMKDGDCANIAEYLGVGK